MNELISELILLFSSNSSSHSEPQVQQRIKKMWASVHCFAGVAILIAVVARLLAPVNCETYVAAVVEYKPNGTPWDTPPRELILKNVYHYIELIEEASLLNADIVVFPEYGLTTLGVPRNRTSAKPYLVEVPAVGYNPCTENIEKNTDPIQLLSCAARQHRIYVVVNLGEILPCTPEQKDTCPSDGVFQYNANVVFDRDGAIVAKYHKTKLYFEDQFDSPLPPEYSIFETDFGVTFGQFICYDIIFYDPAVELIARGLRNIIYTSAWVDELPFLMGIQSHALWAASANVNLLASGYHQPLGGQLGSGIYSGTHGALNYSFDPESGTRLVLAEVPRVPYFDPKGTPTKQAKSYSKSNGKPSTLAFHSYLKENLTLYSSNLLTSDFNAQTVCHGEFCCSARVKMSCHYTLHESTVNYRVIAFDGIRKTAQETAEFGWQVCALVRCLNETLESCSIRSETDDESDQANRIAELELVGGPFEAGGVMQPALNTLDTKFDIIPFDTFDITTTSNDSDSDSDGLTVEVHSMRLVSHSIQMISIIKRTY